MGSFATATSPPKPWRETPLVESAELSRQVGCRIFLKYETLQPSGSFKSRAIGSLIQHHARSLLAPPADADAGPPPPPSKARRTSARSKAANGTTKAGTSNTNTKDAPATAAASPSRPRKLRFFIPSGGNAGLAATVAARDLGFRCTVVVPTSSPGVMRTRLAAEGADVVVHGGSLDEAGAYMQNVLMAGESEGKGEAKGEGDGQANGAAGEADGEPQPEIINVALHPFDHPAIWDGVSSIVEELAYQLPPADPSPPSSSPAKTQADPAIAADAIVCSVGGGGLMNGIAIGLDRLLRQREPQHDGHHQQQSPSQRQQPRQGVRQSLRKRKRSTDDDAGQGQEQDGVDGHGQSNGTLAPPVSAARPKPVHILATETAGAHSLAESLAAVAAADLSNLASTRTTTTTATSTAEAEAEAAAALDTAGDHATAARIRAHQPVQLPAITSQAASLGARAVARRTLDTALHPPVGVGVRSAVLTDAQAARGCLRLADAERVLVELACGICVEAVAGVGAGAGEKANGVNGVNGVNGMNGVKVGTSGVNGANGEAGADGGASEKGKANGIGAADAKAYQPSRPPHQLLGRDLLMDMISDFGPQSRVVVVVCGGSSVSVEQAAEWRRQLADGWE